METTEIKIGEVLQGMSKAGRLSKNDKRWVTTKLDEQRRHELNMKLLQAFETNPDLPFVLMFLGGAASAAALEIIQNMKDAQKAKESGDKNWTDMLIPEGMESQASAMYDVWSMFGGGWVIDKVVGDQIKGLWENKAPKTWVDVAVTTAQSLSISVSAFGASILVLRAIFGNSTKDGGMASLAGLIA